MKRALIFGAGGQAGYYMIRFLHKKGYEVVALDRNGCDVTFAYNIKSALFKFKPDEVYNFASKMFAPDSWNNPVEYLQINSLSVSHMLHEYFKMNPDGKFFNAGSAEMFDLRTHIQSERTPIRPRNPYGVSKAAAYELVRIYREEKDMFAVTGIFFNMESPRRLDTFFTRKVVKAVSAIKAGTQNKLTLGNLSAQRDWGLVEEYVEAAWLMLQANYPHDYVIGTGESHSCLQFVEEAFKAAGLDMSLEYEAIQNKNDILKSDPRQIEKELGWKAKTTFYGVVKYLVEAEIQVGVS
jgi:GDPmannose 4,6-dehydratase